MNLHINLVNLGDSFNLIPLSVVQKLNMSPTNSSTQIVQLDSLNVEV